ncbi:GNAT family N-acetyltransferase [Oleomonas cavernae]|uniref:GNAT family N-acetyltransferase n=1 Tax=Oleomonas cavernae TaxID=2320859 RepID=A0A418W9J9_9PROT|nr:GNAT family N-acetyltransferase [Oleomonas cavernae]RJF86668.1 GNAT family N-acetyltransferase [Oleomonas cavernae]
MTLSIRAYEAGDLPALIELFRGAVRGVAARDYTPAQILAWAPDDLEADDWLPRLAAKRTWVARIAGEPMGFSDLEADGHIDMMFVHAGHQGQGIATRLLATVEAAARAAGLPRLHTEASITARPFFARRGFTVITAQSVSLGDQQLTNYRMEKFL